MMDEGNRDGTGQLEVKYQPDNGNSMVTSVFYRRSIGEWVIDDSAAAEDIQVKTEESFGALITHI